MTGIGKKLYIGLEIRNSVKEFARYPGMRAVDGNCLAALDWTAEGGRPDMCLPVLLAISLSKLLSRKQKSPFPAYNFCSRIH
jgi:hypothetical protein